MANILLQGTLPDVARSSLAQESLVVWNIPLTAWRVWDNLIASLPAAAAADDLGLIQGTFASASPSIQGVDFGGTTTTAYARTLYPLPVEYDSGQDLRLRVHCGALTTVSDTNLDIDVEVFKSNKAAGIGSDLCLTALMTCNSLTLSGKQFVIDPSGLVTGDTLDMRITMTATDSGNAGVMIPFIGETAMLMDVRG
jgi:hypothetical protein